MFFPTATPLKPVLPPKAGGASRRHLQSGKLITIDYGLTAGDLSSQPAARAGTLRAYFRHHASDDLLANVGNRT